MAATHIIIEQEILKWSPVERVTLAERLLESVDGFATLDIDQAWRTEVANRVGEIESGKVPAIDSDEVFSEARRKLNEARKISSSRPK